MLKYLSLFRTILFLCCLASVASLSACQSSRNENDESAFLTIAPAVVQATVVSSTIVPTAAFSSLPSLQPKPWQIVGVSPPELSIVPINLYQADLVNENFMYEGVRSQEGGYSNSVCVAFLAVPIRQEREMQVIDSNDAVLSPDRLRRAQLILNNNTLTQVVKDLWWGPMGHTFCWDTDLGPGSHQASFRFQVTSDEVIEYTWNFIISNESIPLATMTPRRY